LQQRKGHTGPTRKQKTKKKKKKKKKKNKTKQKKKKFKQILALQAHHSFEVLDSQK
jgi:hypothetical protein